VFFKKKYQAGSSSLSALTWRKFCRDGLALISLSLITFATFIAVTGYLITPDATPYANNQILEIALQKPGFSVLMLKVRKKETEKKVSFFEKMIYGKSSEYNYIPINSYIFSDDKIYYTIYSGKHEAKAIISYLPLNEVIFSTSANETLKTNSKKIVFENTGTKDKKAVNKIIETINKNSLVRKHFLLGTDRYGRDVLSQLMIGTRVSLSVGCISVLISLVIGIFMGSLAGFFRGWIDDAIMWLINVVWSVPTLLLVIVISFALGKGFWQVFIAVGLTMWVEVARVTRGQIFSLREKDYVEACKALGFKNSKTIFKHILPNIMGVIIVISAANFSSAILIEAGLSFLGIGVQPPMPSWGTMIKENYGYIILDYAYLAIIPGIAIMLMVLAFMLVGNALRDAFDVKTVGREIIEK